MSEETPKPVLESVSTGYPMEVLLPHQLLSQVEALQQLTRANTTVDFRQDMIRALFEARVRPSLLALGLPEEPAKADLSDQVKQLAWVRLAVEDYLKLHGLLSIAMEIPPVVQLPPPSPEVLAIQLVDGEGI